jgi:hypothetical protein
MKDFDSALCRQYEKLCLTRLSKNFILRDFMFSTEAAVAGHSNFPSDNVDQAKESGVQLCERVLEPILAQFGRFAITFGYQSRETMELLEQDFKDNPTKSSPHHWDRGTFGTGIYARVDIWPFCVEDGDVSKVDFARWCMMNLDIDLFMMWRRANIFCITISPKPRRVWLEWVPTGQGTNGGNKIEHMGRDFWVNQFPQLPPEKRPLFHPSDTNGSMRFGKKVE